MICALTVRKLKPGSFDQFREAFMSGVTDEKMPEGWTRFNMVRSVDDADEVICFGFFDGDLASIRANADAAGYKDQQAAIAPFVKSVGADGFYEIVEDITP